MKIEGNQWEPEARSWGPLRGDRCLSEGTLRDFLDSKSLFYIRTLVTDKPGVIATITSILRDHKISIKSLFQKQVNSKSFNVVILTQNTNNESVTKASIKLNKCKFLKESSKVLQVLHI